MPSKYFVSGRVGFILTPSYILTNNIRVNKHHDLDRHALYINSVNMLLLCHITSPCIHVCSDSVNFGGITKIDNVLMWRDVQWSSKVTVIKSMLDHYQDHEYCWDTMTPCGAALCE